MKVTLFRDLPTERWWSMERYADELTRALQSIDSGVESYVLPRPLPQLRGTSNTLANQLWRSIAYPLAARAHQGNVNHIIDHSYAHLVNALDPGRTIVTCHDIAPLALNEGRGVSRRLWDYSFRAMLGAKHIIADSDFTRTEILRHSDYSAEQITVVPLAVGTEFFEPIIMSDIHALRQKHHLDNHHIILHVGSCAPRKNVELILRALLYVDAVFIQLGGAFTLSQREIIASLEISEQILQLPPLFGYPLRLWYHLADLFVFPSLYEGFGMPVLEAMACGTPVVCTDTSSLIQVAGDAALLTNPNEPTKLAEQITRVLNDATIAQDLRVRGIARAEQFTWERTARETFDVYKKIFK